MDRLLGMLALLGFVCALGAHLCGLAGYNLMAALPGVMALHAGIFLVFFPFVLSLRRQGLNRRETFRADLEARLPRAAVLLGRALFLYMVLNFVLVMLHGEDGSPQRRGDAYVVQTHGQARPISEAEFNERQAWILRGFSGHWLVFYYFPMAWFLLRDRRQDAATGAAARF